MKKIDSFLVPESWDDITISQLIKLQEIKQQNNIQTHFKVLQVFNPKLNPQKFDFNTVMTACAEIYKTIQEAPVMQPLNTYQIGENVYYIKEIDEIDFQCFLDFQSLTNGGDDWERITNLGLILSILTKNVPDDVDLKAFGKQIQDNVSVGVGSGVLNFFLEKLTAYLESSPTYSEMQAELEKVNNLTKTE